MSVMRTSMRATVRRGLAVVAATLIFVGLTGAGAARGAEGLYGYQMRSTATAISLLYNQPSFGLPSSPTFELRKIHTTAALDSGPSARALASPLWPGDVIANASPAQAFDVLIFDPTAAGTLEPALAEIRTNAAEGSKDFPAYPIRAEAFYPESPSNDNDASFAGEARAKANKELADASASSGVAGVAGAIKIGSLQSASTSAVVGSEAVATSVAEVSGIDMFGGVIKVDNLIAEATTTSDGTTSKITGRVSISGMSLGGFPVVVDEKGIKLGGNIYDPHGALAKQLMKDVLEPNGITLTVARPIDIKEGPAASRGVAALIVRLDSFGMNKLVDALPEDSRKLIRSPSGGPLAPLFEPFSPSVAGLATSPTQFDQSMSFVFGSIAVDTAASPAFDFTIPDVGGPITNPPVFAPPIGGFDPGIGGTTGGAPAVVQPPPPLPTVSGTPVAVVGLPAALAGLLIALGLAATGGLRRFAEAVTAVRAEQRCSLERP